MKETSLLKQFTKTIQDSSNLEFKDYDSLHKWSTDDYQSFWQSLLEFSKISYKGNAKKVIDLQYPIYKSSWFPEVKLNYTQNCFSHGKKDIAIKAYNESGKYKEITYPQLEQDVAKLSSFLTKKRLLKKSYAVAIAPNIPENIVAFLATTKLGAVYSSCSPEFGASAIIDRFKQLKPKILFSVSGYMYNGKYYDISDKIKNIVKEIPSIKFIIQIPYLEKESKKSISDISLTNIIKNSPKIENIKYKIYDFDHPLYSLFTSGTTGSIPKKAIIHGAGRAIIQHKKELMLHCNYSDKDNLFFFTTCSWMMWNWMLSALTIGGTITIYDGSAFSLQKDIIFKIIQEAKVTIFGIGARYFPLLEKYKLSPKDNFDLSSLKTILTTGSPLVEENFDYIYKHIKEDVHLSSISGGTEIVSCFVLGNPDMKVNKGYIQCKGLGMDVHTFDKNGNSLYNQKGELICATPFPSMPVKFLNDENYENYYKSYYSKYLGIWNHEDYAIINDKGIKILGHSDTTLNPGGVRIGTAEIYRMVERIPEIADSLVLGIPKDNDEVVYLFIKLTGNLKLDEKLKTKISDQIKTNLSPKHVPKMIVQVPDIPYTFSGKKLELPIKKLLLKEITEIQSVQDVQSLNFFINYNINKS